MSSGLQFVPARLEASIHWGQKLTEQDRIFTKCAWRLIPFMGLLYLVNFIDRLNVGLAALTMNRDLSLSASAFGFGAGIFFIGYILFQVPANIILARAGARLWIFCILAIWGLVSAATAFVTGPTSFYILRFLLGIGESGFFPGMIFYLTLWFPKTYRARFTANFSLAVPLSAIVGGPLSGLILGMDGVVGLHGWQWMFLLEGLPAFLLAFAVLKFLPDGPGSASWLDESEKRVVASRLAGDSSPEEGSAMAAFRDWRFWAMGLVGFLGFSPPVVGTTLFLPQIVQAMGFSNSMTGFVVALPYLVCVLPMILLSRSSDLKRERIWHFAIPMLSAAAGFAVASITRNYVIELCALTVAMAGVLSAGYGPYYSLISSFSSGKTAAAGIALANALNVTGAFAGPAVFGILKDQTGDYTAAMALLAVGAGLSAMIVLALGRSLLVRPAVMVPKTVGTT